MEDTNVHILNVGLHLDAAVHEKNMTLWNFGNISFQNFAGKIMAFHIILKHTSKKRNNLFINKKIEKPISLNHMLSKSYQ